MKTVVMALTCLAGTLAQPANAQHEPQPLRRNELRSELLGCYALYSERGRIDGSFYNASPAVRLDSARWAMWTTNRVPGFRAMFPLTETLGRAKIPAVRPPNWSADSLTDSVRLSFVNGFSGTVLVLNAPPGKTDTLVGRVFESWDFGPPFETPRGGARAVRVQCGS